MHTCTQTRAHPHKKLFDQKNRYSHKMGARGYQHLYKMHNPPHQGEREDNICSGEVERAGDEESDLLRASRLQGSLQVPLADDAVQVGHLAKVVGAVDVDNIRQVALEVVMGETAVIVVLQDVAKRCTRCIWPIQLRVPHTTRLALRIAVAQHRVHPAHQLQDTVPTQLV